MKLYELKKMLNSLTKKQLERELVIYNQELSYSQMGIGKRAKSKLIWDGEDDPSPLRTFEDLKEEFNNEEIGGMEIMFERGDFYIEVETNHLLDN